MGKTLEPSLDLQQHIVLHDVSWDFYEHLLKEIGDRPIRLTYDNGDLEIMSPLPKHEQWKKKFSRLFETLSLELDIEIEPLGSTTFRKRAKKKGLEPDECYYIANADAAREMEDAFDPKLHPPPDLAIEIDITSRSVDREPIYAALGVPELWRFDGKTLHVLKLRNGAYEKTARSTSFPWLPMDRFADFAKRMRKESSLRVLRDFRVWVHTLR